MKKAFVIMPYDKSFNRLYSMIIQNALEKKGYECIRQDMTGQGGHIMKNVIINIAESDLVVADLSDHNWNVAYELGIRHTMNRNGTILMCRKDQKDALPFDINGVNVLYYDPDWIDSFSEDTIIAELEKRIVVCETGSSADSDSPVHDVFTGLPAHLLQGINSASQDGEMIERIQQLQKENAKLRERLENAGLSDQHTEHAADIRRIFNEAIDNSIYYSDDAVNKLKEFSSKGMKREFADFLADVLEKGYLDEADCKIVYRLCRDHIKVPPLTKVFLEHAAKLYPDNEELNIYLANELGKSYENREQALVIANDMIGVNKRNGKYESTKHVTYNVIVAFFNLYLRLKKYKEILLLKDVLLQEYSRSATQALIYRNAALAHLNLEQLEEAEKNCSIAMEYAPENDMGHYIQYRIHRASENFSAAYRELEQSIACAPTNEDNYYAMAGFICDENYARTSVEEEPQLIHSNCVRDYAVPFIIYALHLNRNNYSQAIAFLSRNGFDSDAEHCINTLKQNADLLSAFKDLDFSFVGYCIEEKNNGES